MVYDNGSPDVDEIDADSSDSAMCLKPDDYFFFPSLIDSKVPTIVTYGFLGFFKLSSSSIFLSLNVTFLIIGVNFCKSLG